MATGRLAPRAVVLADGSVVVVGDDGPGFVRASSIGSEVWDPVARAWSAGPSLNAPRADFAAVQVDGGGVLVTGGVNAGTSVESQQDHHQSYSSTYVLDPGNALATWTRVGLLRYARTAPVAASLQDGRVLVAGGYYLSGATGARGAGIDLTVARPGGAGTAGRPLGDVAPPALVPALATAELYDPSTGAWSATGPLRYARVAAAATTLADGRVLVVGSAQGNGYWWNYSQPKVDARAYGSAEIYDPRTGRFNLTADLPPVDWSPLATWGPYSVNSDGVTHVGTLVPLDDGGALLVGQVTSWSVLALELSGSTVRTLRLDARTGQWTQVDQAIYGTFTSGETETIQEILRGHTREGVVAARLRDGRVLFAGGSDIALTALSELYDPLAGTWSPTPPLPQPRGDGTALALPDGSVLVVGGYSGPRVCGDCAGLATAVRFVPGP